MPALAAQNYNLLEALTGDIESVIIGCPSCGVRFNLDPAKLLPAGRNVRCAKCGHRWRQMPEGMEAEAEPGLEALPAEPARAAPAPAAPPPEPEPQPEPQPAPEPEPAAAAAPPEEAEPHPPSPPETPAEMAQSLAAIAEQVAGARPPGYKAGEAPPAGPNPIARLARRAQPGSTMGPITAPPRMRPMRPARRSPHLGLILIAGLVVGLLIAAYVFRDVIARAVPGADVVYSLFGLSTDNPAADLEISIDTAKINTDEATGRKIFDLYATVFNLSTSPLDMPPLMVIPVDDAGSPMEPLAFRLQERVIEPGQNIKFRKSFEDWPPTAPNFELRVANAE